MEAFLVSLVVVAIGEIGDKTQLLSLFLAARFRKPVPIICAIAVATLANHALAGWVGTLVGAHLSPNVLRISIAVSFVAIAVWTLRPDELDTTAQSTHGASVFLITLGSFFLAEVGDKTQIATVALAARFHDLLPVIAGSTLGILIADVPAVLIGGRAGLKLPFKTIRWVAAILFLVLSLVTFFSIDG